MSKLLVRIGDAPVREIPLTWSKLRVGSDASCEVRLDHPEAAPHSLNLEERGGAYMVQNCNRYVIYVGSESLPPQGWALWRPGQELLLSQSITLQVAGEAGRSGAAAGEAPRAAGSSTASKAVQLGVTIVCLVAAFVMLTKEQRPTLRTGDSFQSLIRDLQGIDRPSQDDQRSMRYLQEAWLLERRRSPRAALEAYQLLMNHAPIRDARPDEQSLASRIKSFASARITALEGRF